MSELRRSDEPMSTTDVRYPDVSYPPRPRSEQWDGSAVALADENTQPGKEIVPAKSANGQTDGAYAAENFEGPLFADAELKSFRDRWDQVQASFVDEPREAVRNADSLVASVVQRIEEQFARERDQLERQWDGGTNVSTEDMRQAIKRYRALFGRLLAF